MKNQNNFKRRYPNLKTLAVIFFIGAFSVNAASAQSQYKLSPSADNIVKILGSSNVHDWTMTAQNPVCEADFTTAPGEVPKALRSFSFTVNSKSLKSEHSSMDDRTYKTIKADTYPQITFKLTGATIATTAKDKFTINAAGTLTIAGVSKAISLQVNGEVKSDNSITCTGSQKLKLTDFKIDPPSFMLGAMKVKDDLTIQYNLNFKKQQQIASQIN
ncbi:YceI family protein [Mucilaginibacter sp. AW1-3]